MSLRGRVIALVVLMLLASVSVYVAISWTSARADLAGELASAQTGGVQTVRSAFEDLPRSDHPQRDLRQLVATFNGNRHLRVSVSDRAGRVWMQSRPAMRRQLAPRWFSALVTPDLQPVVVRVPDGRDSALTLYPDPASDVAALWAAVVDAAGVFASAAAVGLALVYWVIGRALAPLVDLSAGLGAIGAGAYRQHVQEQGPPEVRRLQLGFNAMAERLADIDARNRALEGQLLTIQDEERAEIARDLHDEIGPHLFAVALDVEMIGRSLAENRTSEIPDELRSIQSAVSYMQREVRELIATLRPTRASELGLHAALEDLITFWKTRQPSVDFVADLKAADEVPERLRDVIYRVVQESVANALKHAATKHLSIAARNTGGAILVTVANQGLGKTRANDTPGLGLVSMRERVSAAGGTLMIDRAKEGWTVVARFDAFTELPVP